MLSTRLLVLLSSLLVDVLSQADRGVRLIVAATFC